MSVEGSPGACKPSNLGPSSEAYSSEHVEAWKSSVNSVSLIFNQENISRELWGMSPVYLLVLVLAEPHYKQCSAHLLSAKSRYEGWWCAGCFPNSACEHSE